MKVVNYKHPGRPKTSQGKTRYEDVDQWFQCPNCENGTIDNYSWRCPHCGYKATVYTKNTGKITYKNFLDKEATATLREKLIRINPWTGDAV